MALHRDQVIDFAKRLKDEAGEDDLGGAAAEMAYRFFLALFPFFIFLAALSSFVASAANVQNPTDEIMNMIGESLPEDSAAVLRTQLEGVLQQQNAGLLSVGIIGAIWAASSGVGALMKNMNRMYGVGESRSLPLRVGISLALTIFGAGIVVVAFVILFASQLYGPDIADEVGLGSTAVTVLGLARWPIVLALILVAVAFMYWLAPNASVALKWITPGAVFFGVAWIVASVGFGFYVSNFSSYNETYGALGAVVVLLIWFYLTSFLLLLGAEINGVLAEMDMERDAKASTADEASVSTSAPIPRPIGFAVAGAVWLLALVGALRRRTA